MPTSLPPAPVRPMVYLTCLDAEGSSDSVVALINSVIQMAVVKKMAVNLVVYVGGDDFAKLKIIGGDPPIIETSPLPIPPHPPVPKKQVLVRSATRLNVRSAPVNGTVLDLITQADGWLDVVGEQAGWYKIRWQNNDGWVSAGYVEVRIV